MMIPERIYHLFELGTKVNQEDFIWPMAGKATGNDRVFIICDGDGSFAKGGLASRIVCQFMAAKVSGIAERKMSGEMIDKLLLEARSRLISYIWKKRLDTNLSTTFSMLVLYDQKVFISWLGDSHIYHLRGGEIIFRTEDNPLRNDSVKNTAIARGIRIDGTPMKAASKWIKDVSDGDYILLFSKGFLENITDDDIRSLVSQNDNENIDPTGYFRRLIFEKTPGNFSMYLIRVNSGTQKKSIQNGIAAIRKKTSELGRPVSIFLITISTLILAVFYFRRVRTPDHIQEHKNQTTQSVDVLRNDSVPSAIIISAPGKPILPTTDSAKNNVENPAAAPQKDGSAAIQTEEKPEQIGQPSAGPKKAVAKLMIRLTTDESCKLKITNVDLDEVIDWDLSKNDYGTLYLKPGEYSIAATSVLSSAKTKTFYFTVKPGHEHTTKNLHIRF